MVNVVIENETATILTIHSVVFHVLLLGSVSLILLIRNNTVNDIFQVMAFVIIAQF